MLRRVGGDHAPNNADDDASSSLGEHWRSALCVTSLYDSYVAVQHENEALKSQLAQLKHANELLTVAHSSTKRSTKLPNDHDDDEDDDDHLRQEIRLLRAEKGQQELLFDKRRVQLEAQITQLRAQHAELQTKYQQKFDLDPLAPQRAAAATRSLHHALEQGVREKEELLAQHARVLQRVQQLESGLRDATAQLQRHREAETSVVTRRVRGVLERWIVGRMAHAWRQWRLVTMSERLRRQQEHDEHERRHIAEQKRKAVLQDRAAKMVVKLIQGSTRRSFYAWRQCASERKAKRSREERIRCELQCRTTRRAFRVWRDGIQLGCELHSGVEKLRLLLERHATRRAWCRWTRVAAQTHAGELQRETETLRSQVARLQAQVCELTQTVETVKTQREELVMQAEQTVLARDTHTEEWIQQSELAQRRIGDVLFRRRQRLVVRDLFFSWRTSTRERRRREHKILSFQHDHESKAAKTTVTHWHRVASEQRRFTQITRQVVQRMRLLGAYQCFVAWREFVAVRKERVATLTRVVHHMKNRHLIQCFRTWTQFRTQRRLQRQRLAAMTVIVRRFQLASGLATWRKTSTAISVAAERRKRQTIEHEWRQRLEQSKHEIKQLRVYFQRWQSTVRSDKRFRQLTSKYAIKWKNGTQGKCFDEWKEFVARRRVVRETLRRLAMRRTVKELHAAWAWWRTQTLVRAKDEMLQVVERERDARVQQLEQELTRLRLEGAATQATSAEREQQHTEKLQAMHAALAATQSSCSQYKTALKTMCVTQHHRRLQLQCLRAWQSAVRTAKRRVRLVSETLQRKHEAHARRVLGAWHGLCRTRRRMVGTAGHVVRAWHARLVATCFQSWRVFIVHHLKVRQATTTFETNATRRLCRAVFNTWNRDARTSRLLRKTLEQIWLSSVHAHLAECFTTWSERTREAKRQDEFKQKQLALDAIRTRICARWTAASLKTVLTAWRQGVENQKRSQAAVHRLRRLQDVRLFAIAFQAWRELHAQFSAQRAWLMRWSTRADRKAVVASWQQWKLLTIQRRHEQLVLLQQTCHQQKQTLAEQQHEMVELVANQQQLQQQLETLQRDHGDVGDSADALARRFVVSKCFFHWRLVSTSRKLQTARLARFAQIHQKHIQKRILREWATAVAEQRVKQQSAERRWERCVHTLLRGVLASWRAAVARQHSQKQIVQRFRKRQDRRTLSMILRGWQVFLHHSRAAQLLVSVLGRTVQKLTYHAAFSTWTRIVHTQKALATQHAEQQRRILAFMVDKHTCTIAKCFAAWRTLGMARHTRIETARRLEGRSRQQRLRELWTVWRAHSTWQVNCSMGVDLVVRVVRRHHVRVAFQNWKAQDLQSRLGILSHERHELDRERRAIESALNAVRSERDQLREAVQTLEQTHVELRDSVSTSASVWSSQAQSAQRQAVLAKLLARMHCVPLAQVAVSVAFHRWRYRASLRTRQLEALRGWQHLLTRKQTALHFGRWRRRVASHVRWSHVLNRRASQLGRRVLLAWTQFVRDRVTRRRRFLVRWIEATHTRQAQLELEKNTAMAFRIWQLHAANGSAREKLHHATSSSDSEQSKRSRQQQQNMLLTKWCWRAYARRCHDLRRVLGQWRATVVRDHVTSLQHKLQTLESAKQAGSIDEPIAHKTAQSLQTLFRRIAGAASCSELFDAIASSISQISFGNAAGILFLLDPTTNELWTERRDSHQVMQAPASLGLAGAALAGLSTLLVENATGDARFHPLVDQLAVAGVRSSANIIGMAPTGSTSVELFSTAIVGAEGVAYGVLQVAYVSSQQKDEALSMRASMRILGHACGFFVEQIVHEMVRHSRDHARAQSMQTFTRLFQQNKNWRKYFMQVERDAKKSKQQLLQLLAEREHLVDDRSRLQEALTLLEREQREVEEDREKMKKQSENQELLMKHVFAYKKKTAKLKELVQEKEQLVSSKTRELERVLADHAKYRQEVQSREWQAMLTAVSPKKRTKRLNDDDEGSDAGGSEPSKRKNVLLEGAEVATLRNQLVRAESDSMLLVKAVDVATRHHGDLPETLKMEVHRISQRLKKPRD